MTFFLKKKLFEFSIRDIAIHVKFINEHYIFVTHLILGITKYRRIFLRSLLLIEKGRQDFNLYFFLFQRKEYVKYAKVFPLSGTLDFKVPSKWYRRVVGSLEIICGLAMAIIPSRRCKRPTTFSDRSIVLSQPFVLSNYQSCEFSVL